MSSPFYALLAALALAGVSQASSNLDPQVGWCSNNLTSLSSDVTINSLLGDWRLVYSTNTKFSSGASLWGPGLAFDYCDLLNCNQGCMATGLSILELKDKKQLGYTYSYNAFTETWTIVQFENALLQFENFIGYRITFLHYVQVQDKVLFVDNKPTACGSTSVIRSGPIYRSSNYFVLAVDKDLKWIALLYCDAFYGFVFTNPLVQILVKQTYMDQVSHPLPTCPFYEDIKVNIKKYGFDIFAGDFNLVYHDENGDYPTKISWDSFDWEADCLCVKT